MSHLNPETLARLVDEEPGIEEAAHLERCTECACELAAMREDVHALGMLPDVIPAPDGWAALEKRLADEGLLVAHRPTAAWHLRAAAAVTLFLAGSIAGRMSAPDTITTAAAPANQPAAAQNVAAPAPPPNYEMVAGDVADPTTQPGRSVRLASSDRGPRALNLDEAGNVLRDAETQYLSALTRYAELATQSEPGDPIARLAALQSIVMTTQAALSQAPADPVINGYHLTALAQRDAALAQVAAASGDRWH